MNKRFLLKVTAASFLGTLLVSVLGLAVFVQIADNITEGFRSAYMEFVAKSIERDIGQSGVSSVDLRRFGPPFGPGLKNPHPGPPMPVPGFGPPPRHRSGQHHFGPPPREMVGPGPKPQLWLVDQNGSVISTNGVEPIPPKWNSAPLPQTIHEIDSYGSLFETKVLVMRLEAEPPLYLVAHDIKPPFRGPIFLTQAALTFATGLMAVGLALMITFWYLRRKSEEARRVLTQLESGDLGARFEIQRFDQASNLMLDFNRMAEEIERLVHQVRETEAARSRLLQDLGHDLRTPLTSLSTVIGTLEAHHQKLSASEIKDLCQMANTDVAYFKGLLEQLTVIASLEDPRYRSSTEMVNLGELIGSECVRRRSATPGLQWECFGEGVPEVLGDPRLLERLLKNAYDNAARYARSQVVTRWRQHGQEWELLIQDDGPGFGAEDLATFATRREQRRQVGKGGHLSLGLGSMIMKAIAQAHGGSLEVQNLARGAQLRFRFPVVE